MDERVRFVSRHLEGESVKNLDDRVLLGIKNLGIPHAIGLQFVGCCSTICLKLFEDGHAGMAGNTLLAVQLSNAVLIPQATENN